MADSRQASGFGLERGKVFPAAHARSLLNPLRKLVQSPERTVAAIHIGPADRVLELGCGPGYFSPAMARTTRGGVVLLDLQAEMLEMVRERVPEPLSFPRAGGRRAIAVCRRVLRCRVRRHRARRDSGSGRGAWTRSDGSCVATVFVAIAETRRDSDFIALPALKALTAEHGFRFADKHGLRMAVRRPLPPGW